MTRHTVPIRRSLLVNLVAVIVLLTTAIITTMSLGTRRAIRTLSRSMIMRAIEETESQLHRFFAPVQSGLLLTRSWGEQRMLDNSRADHLTGLLLPVMRAYPQVSSVLVADSRGREFMLLRDGERWRSRLMRRDEWNDTARVIEWTDADQSRRESEVTLEYDPRERPWFVGAVQAASGATGTGTVHWTEPYTFYTTNDPGMTASIVYDEGDEIDRVVGFDVLLSDISDFTTGLTVSRNGQVLVLTDDLSVIGLPAVPRFRRESDRRAALLSQPDQLGLAVATDAMEVFGSRPDAGGDPTRFASDGEAWWGAARKYQLSPQRELWIAVLIPERDLLGGLSRLRLWVIAGSVIVLGLAIGRAVGLARRFSWPLEHLAGESDRISQGDLEPGPPVQSSVHEVQQLAAAHDRMREGLRSLLKLERDLQLARQIQQSTFPRELPRLRGFEIGAWSEPAEETGGDTYDVIGCRDDLPPEGGGDHGVAAPRPEVDRALLLLADATGHGIGPALAVTQIRAMLRMAMRAGESLPSLARHVNDQLCADLPGDRFITAWIGLLDGNAGTLTSFSAGQAPLLRYDAGSGSFENWNADTFPFGLTTDQPIQIRPTLAMGSGDIFAAISDGIFEAQGPGGEQFGAARVMRLIEANRQRSPDEIISALRDEVDRFTAGTPAADDRTGIVIKRR
ncbi:MAG: SpoIIE family protein phosphatase [Planctomycetota bacterium]